nr:hypothetical protein [uncultured Holophaga sp.]
MARVNYQREKRMKDLERLRKQEEKRTRKLQRQTDDPREAEPEDGMSPAETPGAEEP